MHDWNREDSPYKRSDGAWFNAYFGEKAGMFVPYWIQHEIAELLFDRQSLPSHAPDWDYCSQMDCDIMLSLAPDIQDQKELEILAEIIIRSRAGIDSEGEQMRVEVYKASEKYAKWVYKKFFEEVKQLDANGRICVLCEVGRQRSSSDTCFACACEHRHEDDRIRFERYKAKKAGAPATLTLGQWIISLQRYQYRCAYCTTGPYEVIEHFVPISAGGGTTQENCLPACQSCCTQKQNRRLI